MALGPRFKTTSRDPPGSNGTGGRKEGRKEERTDGRKDRMKEGRTECRKEGRQEVEQERKQGRKEGRKEERKKGSNANQTRHFLECQKNQSFFCQFDSLVRDLEAFSLTLGPSLEKRHLEM